MDNRCTNHDFEGEEDMFGEFGDLEHTKEDVTSRDLSTSSKEGERNCDKSDFINIPSATSTPGQTGTFTPTQSPAIRGLLPRDSGFPDSPALPLVHFSLDEGEMSNQEGDDSVFADSGDHSYPVPCHRGTASLPIPMSRRAQRGHERLGDETHSRSLPVHLPSMGPRPGEDDDEEGVDDEGDIVGELDSVHNRVSQADQSHSQNTPSSNGAARPPSRPVMEVRPRLQSIAGRPNGHSNSFHPGPPRMRALSESHVSSLREVAASLQEIGDQIDQEYETRRRLQLIARKASRGIQSKYRRTEQ